MPLVVGAEVFLDASDPEALAREQVRLGYRAAICPDVSIDDTDTLVAIREAFARHRVLIAEVGAWRNIQTPDAAARADNIAYVVHQLAVAEAVGARCCVDVAGSFDGATLSGPRPGNLGREFFDATVETCRVIIDAVKPTRSCLTLEMKGGICRTDLTRTCNCCTRSTGRRLPCTWTSSMRSTRRTAFTGAATHPGMLPGPWTAREVVSR